jgi:arginase
LIPISLGGDHSITYPIIKAFSRKYDKLSILQVDAHPDLYDEFQGNRYSHACPFARIMEEGLAQRLVQVGIRTMNGHQLQQAKKLGVEVILVKDWQDSITLKFDCPLYISFDMDGLDPAFAPGVSHYEPGGLTTRQAIHLIQTVQSSVIAGADIVEFNPARDLNSLTAMTAAKILKELAGKMLITG